MTLLLRFWEDKYRYLWEQDKDAYMRRAHPHSRWERTVASKSTLAAAAQCQRSSESAPCTFRHAVIELKTRIRFVHCCITGKR